MVRGNLVQTVESILPHNLLLEDETLRCSEKKIAQKLQGKEAKYEWQKNQNVKQNRRFRDCHGGLLGRDAIDHLIRLLRVCSCVCLSLFSDTQSS